MTELHSRFTEEDWTFMSKVDVYKHLEIVEEEVAGGDFMSVEVQDSREDALPGDVPSVLNASGVHGFY
ncbi:hypothetical protein JCGZ_19989 [Jatropha curcas]|uniref:Uncharacterized protein n=1 Tax=Jatropha curcas TaxID=180498 RepID=A0A067JV69_JATCU|nr:hypothetical protein JCGZ_19989 [Jatropha curcas]